MCMTQQKAQLEMLSSLFWYLCEGQMLDSATHQIAYEKVFPFESNEAY